MDSAALREYIQTQKGKMEEITSQLEEKETSLKSLQKRYDHHIKARWLVTEAQTRTQIQFKEHIETIVTNALKAIYPNDFTFILDFKRVRNKLECQPMLQEDGFIYDNIKDACGGGVCDIISFALRIGLLSLMEPEPIKLVILDEPFRFLGSYMSKAWHMVKMISDSPDLDFQFLIVTHDEEFLPVIADRTFKVIHNGVHSEVFQMGEVEQEDLQLRRG